jgi:hypothetical protein
MNLERNVFPAAHPWSHECCSAKEIGWITKRLVCSRQMQMHRSRLQLTANYGRGQVGPSKNQSHGRNSAHERTLAISYSYSHLGVFRCFIIW